MNPLCWWIPEIIQGTAFSEDSKLEGISKFNAITLGNLQDTVWWKFKHNLSDQDKQFNLVRYLSGRFITGVYKDLLFLIRDN